MTTIFMDIPLFRGRPGPPVTTSDRTAPPPCDSNREVVVTDHEIFAWLAALGSGLKVAVEQTAHPLEISPFAAGYAVAAPAALFVLLLWVVHRPIVARPVLWPTATLSGVAAILVAPLGARQIGAPAVIAVIAAVSVLLIVRTGKAAGTA